MLTEHRCKKCSRLLCKGNFTGIVEIKCPKCETVNTFQEIETEEVLAIDFNGVVQSANEHQEPSVKSASEPTRRLTYATEIR